MTVETWLSTWLTLRSPTLKPRTIESYADLIRRYVNPAVGAVDLDELRPVQISALLAGIVSAGHTRTAELVFVMLKAAFRELDGDLMRHVPRPRHKQTSPEAWSPDNMAAYMAALVDHKHRLPLTLGLVLGLRRGEICGLRWEHIDFQRAELHVVNQRIRLATGELIDAPPKSAASVRVLPIPEELMRLLRIRRQLSGYLCSLTPSALDGAHRRLVRRLQLPYIPLHGLRHSFATACIRNGGEMKSLQLLMGHSTYAVTANKYTHPDSAMLRAAIDRAARACYNA